MPFGDLLDQTGGMGRFQFIQVIMLAIPVLMMSSHQLLQNFTAAIPDHHCKVKANDTRWTNMTETLWSLESLRAFIPLDGKQRLEKCLRFTTAHWGFANPNAMDDNATRANLEPCMDGWVYDRSEFASTIITEWDLVCDFRRMGQMAQSIYMFGMLVGAVVYGALSDRCGRRIIIIICYFQIAVAGSCAAFSPNYISYCIFRFLAGMGTSGIGLNAVCLTMEWIPSHLRTTVSSIHGYFYSIGQISLGGMAYAIRDWRWLQLGVSLPYFIFFLYSWWFAESARWQIVAGKPEVALRTLKRVAKINGKGEEGEKITLEILKYNMQREMASVKSSYTAVDLVRTPAMCRITFLIAFLWFSTSFSYYALAMDLQNFGVSIYLIQVIFGLVDIPAKCICLLAMNYLGRKGTQAGSLILAGIAILTNIFVPSELQVLRTSLAVLGKGCLASSFLCASLYTGELYPTVIRQTGMGLGGTMTRVGSIVAPLVQITSEYFNFLPPIIYGSTVFISGISMCFLPETRNIPLPETIQDVQSKTNVSDEEQREDVPLRSTNV
ncbi:solute carrier family 22 member 6-A-like [Lissotriton helveticus]